MSGLPKSRLLQTTRLSDAKAKKRADADEMKARNQSGKQAAAEKKTAEEKVKAVAEYWRTVDMECARGVAQTFSRFLADDPGSQNILLLQRHSVLRWRYKSALSRCLAMLTSARHQKATTATTKLACCLAALTSAAGATDGADTILAVRDLSSRCCRQWYNTVAPWWQTVHKDDQILHWSAHCLSYFMNTWWSKYLVYSAMQQLKFNYVINNTTMFLSR